MKMMSMVMTMMMMMIKMTTIMFNDDDYINTKGLLARSTHWGYKSTSGTTLC